MRCYRKTEEGLRNHPGMRVEVLSPVREGFFFSFSFFQELSSKGEVKNEGRAFQAEGISCVKSVMWESTSIQGMQVVEYVVTEYRGWWLEISKEQTMKSLACWV